MTRLLDTVGDTPLVKLQHFGKEFEADIYVKLEYFNPTSSLKDRTAKYMIEKAESDGRLKPGYTIIENSSGNTATALAMIAKQKGYKLILVVRDTLSPDKKKVLEAFGVQIIETDTSLPYDHPEAYHNFARTYARKHARVFFMDQHDNTDNHEAHYRITGPEILRQTGGELDFFIAGMGTGGTLSGIGRALKEHNPDIQVIGVDPLGSAFRAYYYDEPLPLPTPHFLEGIGNAYPTRNLIKEYIDEVIAIKDTEAIKTIRKLITTEGIIGGPSAGANLLGALEIARRYEGKKKIKIVTIIGDTGYKYSSTLFNDEWLKKVLKEEYKEIFS